MQVVDKAVHAPSVCFVCEQAPTENQKVIDTFRSFDPGVVTPLNGRKYVCEGCVETTAHLIGHVSGPVHAEIDDAYAKARARIAELEEENKSLKDFKDLADRFVPKPKPATRKKNVSDAE